MNRNRKNLFDSLFGDDFMNSFFSIRGDDRVEGSDFPEDGDPNFHKTEENIDTGNHTVKKEVWVSTDGTQRYERTSMVSKAIGKALREPTLEELKSELQKAVENQKYEDAAKLRDEIKKIEAGK